MTWLVFLVSAVLTLAGAAAILSGAPIIQIERGWAEVIAGAVAVSGGAITFAIGGVLARMRAIERAVLAARQPVAAVEPSVSPAELGLRETIAETEEPRSDIALPVESSIEAAEPAEPQPRHGLWKRIRDLDGDSVEPSGLGDRPTTRMIAPADLRPVIPVAMPEPQERSPAITVHEEDVRSSAPEVLPPLSAAATPEQEQTDSIDWLDHGLSSPRPPRPSFLNAELPHRDETSDAMQEAATTEEDAAPRDTASEPHHAAAEAAPTMPGPAEEVTVVGRYQAGVASYVMYSNGTIEVETEGGNLQRFGSMDELKAFIARQETTVG